MAMTGVGSSSAAEAAGRSSASKDREGDRFAKALADKKNSASTRSDASRRPDKTPPLPMKRSEVLLAARQAATSPLPAKGSASDQDVTASPAPRATTAPRVTYGPSEPETGVERHLIGRTAPSPSHAYLKSSFDYRPKDVQDLLAATPKLDPKSFGDRPAAAPGAARRLQPGEEIVVLDRPRLHLLEEQRQLLQQIEPAAKTDEQIRRREAQIDALTNSIIREVDYATARQAVPDRRVADTLRQRAPHDRTYNQSIDRAMREMEAKWQEEGRTPDQIGKLLKAGESHDLGRVQQLAREQLAGLAEKLGPGTHGAVVKAAIDGRAGVYMTFVTADPGYRTAIAGAARQAEHDVLVEGPIKRVLAKAEAGGDGWQARTMKALETETDPNFRMPGQVKAIMSDERIKHGVRQSLRFADRLDTPAEGPIRSDGSGILHDVAMIYGRTLHADGKTPGAGKALVHEMASFILANTDYRTFKSNPEARLAAEAWNHAFRETTAAGYPGLALAVSAKANDYLNPGFAGDAALASEDSSRGHPAFSGRFDPISAVDMAIHHEFRARLEQAMSDVWQNGQFVAAPLQNLGAHLSDGRRKELAEKLVEAFPKESAAWQDAIVKLDQIQGEREALDLSLNAYAPALEKSAPFDRARNALSNLPVPPSLAEPQPSPATSSTWLKRSARLLTDTLLIQGTGRAIWPDRTLSSGEVVPSSQVNAGTRLSRGFSSYLFANNALELVDSELIDQMFVPVHAAMAFGEMSKAVLSREQAKALWGIAPDGSMNAPFGNARRYQELETRMMRFLDGADMPSAMKQTMTGVGKFALTARYLAPLDMAYAFVDGVNAYAYFTGDLRDGKTDLARGAAYTLSTAGDLSFLAGSGGFGAGAATRLGPLGWTAVGAGLLVTASSVNYYKGRYDKAHNQDEHNAKAWQLLGIKNPQIARSLGQGDALGDRDMRMNAGSFLTEYFHKAFNGSTSNPATEAMVRHINENWSVRDTDRVAQFVKDIVVRDGPNGPFASAPEAELTDPFLSLAVFAKRNSIPLPWARSTP